MKKDVMNNSLLFWTTAQEFIRHYLPGIRKASRHTVSSYRDGINAFISYLEEVKLIKRQGICFRHFSSDIVKEYQDFLLNTRNNTPKTVNLRLTALRSFMEYTVSEIPELMPLYLGIRDIKDSRVSSKPIEFFEKNQMKEILASPDTRTKTGRRNQMMLILMYDGAARVSELLELNIGSIHLKSKVPYVTLHGKGNKYRNVPLMGKTCSHLKRYLDEFHDGSSVKMPLFYARSHEKAHQLSSDTMENLIKACSQKVRDRGIEMPENCHCHMVRKTRAMDLYQAGVPLTHIQQLLGHEDISTTSGFYAFATLDTLAKAMDKALSKDSEEEKTWKNPDAIKKLYSL